MSDRKPRDLPVFSYLDEIISSVSENPITIITGEPGSGKTTQIPQILLDSDIVTTLNSSYLKIAVTQPRRVAAIAMARRVSYERRVRLGNEIGYSIRFEDVTSNRTAIKFLTDGVLLRECLQDKLLNRYDIVILDEAHERSLDTDILLALLKTITAKRNNFRLIVTSATLDIGLFKEYLPGSPVISIEGRQFPIEILHSSIKGDKRVEYSVNAAIRIHLHEPPGDILVFLTGSEECEKACKICYEKLQNLVDMGKEVPSMMILSLYGAMSSEEQNRVFSKPPPECRKVVFATNIAETSLTLDGIGYVIDCGYVKQKKFNNRTGLEALVVVPISRQQAKQRAGRAGRTQEGKCFRLYSEQFYEQQMDESSLPEIKRVNLSNTQLTLKAMGIHDVIHFNFIEPPSSESVLMALKQLFLLDVVEGDGSITALGYQMAKLPLEPSYSRCLISSKVFKCESSMITVIDMQLVSMLSSENIWRPLPKNDLERLQEIKEKQKLLRDKSGDHMTYLKIYEEWQNSGYSDEWCNEFHINARALRNSRDIRSQLKEMLSRISILPLIDSTLKHNLSKSKKLKKSPSQRVRISLCFGFYMNAARGIAYGQPGAFLSVSDGSMLHIDGSCSISILESYPNWIIFTLLGGSSMTHGKLKEVSKIKSEWIEDLVPKLNQLDLTRLSGGLPAKRPREEEQKTEEKASPNEKINKARERYLQRKGK